MARQLIAKARVFDLVLGLSVLLTACGGSQAPAESPELIPAPESATPDAETPSDTASDGEHIMPDGTKMKGDHHGEHTMPDGTKMEGDQHEPHD